MLTKKVIVSALFIAAATTVSVSASAYDQGTNLVIGGVAGAAIGSVVGGRNGAILGGVLGAAVGASARGNNGRGYYDRGNDDRGGYYRRPAAYYAPPPVYVRPEPVYYRPAPQVYYQPVREYPRQEYYQESYAPRHDRDYYER